MVWYCSVRVVLPHNIVSTKCWHRRINICTLCAYTCNILSDIDNEHCMEAGCMAQADVSSDSLQIADSCVAHNARTETQTLLMSL